MRNATGPAADDIRFCRGCRPFGAGGDRRIRDWDGAEGWVYHSLLSGKRTAFVAKSKTASAPAALRESADPESPLKAMLEPGVLGVVKRCSGRWCRFLGNGFDGWIEQERLWGVYPNEKVE